MIGKPSSIALNLQPISKAPTVSVVITCYNLEGFIEEAILSCRSQTQTPDEIIVINDGSTDRSADILKRLARGDPRTRVFDRTNGGRAQATSFGLGEATCDIVLLLDGDDVMAPDRVAKVVAAFGRSVYGMSPGLVHHQLRNFGQEMRSRCVFPAYRNASPEGWIVCSVRQCRPSIVTVTSGLAIRHELLQAILPLPIERESTQDLPIISAAAYLAPTAYIAEPLTYYRIHRGQDTNQPAVASAIGTRRLLRQLECNDTWLRAWLQKRGCSEMPNRLEDYRPYLWLRYIDSRYRRDRRAHEFRKALSLCSNCANIGLERRVAIAISTSFPFRVFRLYATLVYGDSFLKRLARACIRRAGYNTGSGPRER